MMPADVRKAMRSLPSDPDDLLTEEDKAKYAMWAAEDRTRKTRIAMETGVDRVG